ncbi:hypothetical protein SmJEL517_g01295 [Synchytrium microbalum]|uniref:ATP synthase mitochondrial F1 complex assembly factor 1 n=1 Tax=Synchytrium microbalum TaxID=1806994 RepID=A0A507CAF7_9FUNG|nr:uncharacterized protein SmJEL517_g01295 [Synchytrium microbalum]TPX36592.1 hypothetical protein SmJEL517_g01295 [Synchytrium microbalum]
MLRRVISPFPTRSFASHAGMPWQTSSFGMQASANNAAGQTSNASSTSASSVDDPFYKKYQEKINQKVKSAGVKSVEELKQKLITPVKPSPAATSARASGAQQPKPLHRPAPYKRKDSSIKPLSDILQMDLIQHLDAEALTKIWNEHHSNLTKDVISGVMTKDFYERQQKRSSQYPTFVLPLPRKEGFEFFYLQHSGCQTYLTSLLEYKTRIEGARPSLVMTHYDDLADKMGIVVMRGEIGVNTLTAIEARNLAYLIQLYYVSGDEKKLALVERFHHSPQTFNYQDLIDSVETLA